MSWCVRSCQPRLPCRDQDLLTVAAAQEAVRGELLDRALDLLEERGAVGEAAVAPYDVEERRPVRPRGVGDAAVEAREDHARLGALDVHVVLRVVARPRGLEREVAEAEVPVPEVRERALERAVEAHVGVERQLEVLARRAAREQDRRTVLDALDR